MPPTPRSIGLALALGVPAIPAPAQGQVQVREQLEPASLSTHASILAVNALLGGVSAGVLRAANGGSFLEAFTRGLAGGGLVYGGKGIASRSFTGAGMLGRQLAGVGNSVMMNASDGHPMFGRLLLPAGPLPGRVLLTVGSTVQAQPIVDLASTIAVATGLLSTRYSLDLGETLSNGAAVFREAFVGVARIAEGSAAHVSGASTVGSAIFVNELLLQSPASLAHERVHVIQFDFLLASLGDRADTWVVGGAGFDRYFKLNTMVGAFGMINQTMFFPADRHKTPWEKEARSLAGQLQRPTVVVN